VGQETTFSLPTQAQRKCWDRPRASVNSQSAITQAGIARKQTLIAFEDMYVWGPVGQEGRHTFYKNNEMAGCCAVLHALHRKGIDGHYSNQRKAIIFSFGAVSRGAIYAFEGARLSRVHCLHPAA
jgi:N5-(carboxyethyl)ornithine synthase